MRQRETLQARIYKDILIHIYEGEFPNGSSLPTLEELSRQYQVGENCIRAVIGRLKENGYLSTKQGRPAHIVYQLKQSETETRTQSGFFYDKKKLYSFYEMIQILFPSIYTYASLTCTKTQLAKLSQILPSGEGSCSDYVDLNIRFCKTVLSSVQNNLILHIVQSVVQSTVLPAALIQRESNHLEEEFLQSSAVMHSIYRAILKNDVPYIKKQWKQLFEITESVVQKATSDSQEDILSKEHGEVVGLEYANEFKYLLIAHDLYEKILEGKHPVGTFLPTIAEAQKIYCVAKITVQTAYHVLADLEIIKTIHGRGSKVIQLTFGSTFAFDESTFHLKKREYLETIEFLQIVCEDIILHTNSLSFRPLKDRLEGELNPSHQYSALILCRYLMKEAHSFAFDTFYQVISSRLYWGVYFKGTPEGISLEEKHCLCMEIVDALEQKQMGLAVALTKKLLTALYCNVLSGK